MDTRVRWDSWEMDGGRTDRYRKRVKVQRSSIFAAISNKTTLAPTGQAFLFMPLSALERIIFHLFISLYYYCYHYYCWVW